MTLCSSDAMDEYFERQNRFTALLIQAYDEHRIPNWYVFKPYIEWKRTKVFRITNAEIREMRSVAHRLLSKYDEIYPNAMDGIDFNNTEDIFYLTRGYGKDAEVVGFLTEINEELTNILILRFD